MAHCPKCGRHLKITDWKPNCPGCGVNLVYYGLEERLQEQADQAEAEHAGTQQRIDRLKASFIGSKLAIIRIFVSILPIAALMLPLCSVTYSGPFIEQTTKSINAIGIYNLVSSMDFGSIITLAGSKTFGTGFIGYLGSVVGILLSLVSVILSLVLLMLACSPKGKSRNIIMNSLNIIFAVAALVLFVIFKNNMSAAFPEFFSASIGVGAWVYLGTLVLLLALNIYLAIKPIEVKYKPTFVGGIPSEEYFELVKNGTPIEEIHAIMDEALTKQAEEKARKLAEKNAKKEEEATA